MSDLHAPAHRRHFDDLPSRYRVASYGWDPSRCGIGASIPGASQIATGIRVPFAPTGFTPHGEISPAITVHRYLFQLCTIKLAPGRAVRLVGLGQLRTIGCLQQTAGDPAGPPNYPIVQSVETPTWEFVDTLPAVWAVRVVRQPPMTPWSTNNKLSCDSFAWRYSDTPALLYETATFGAHDLNWNGSPVDYTTLTNYTAPYNGGIPGEPVGDYGHFTSLEHPWNDPTKRAIDPCVVEGPGALVFFVQLSQTNAMTRPQMTVPAMFPVQPTALPEETLVIDYPAGVVSGAPTITQTGVINWGVAGWMEVER